MISSLVVNVTQDEILLGEALGGGAETCPIALAMKHMGYEGVEVGKYHAGGYLPHDWSTYVEYDLPEAARSFVTLFDNDLAMKVAPRVEPTVFTLTPRVWPIRLHQAINGGQL